MVDYCGVNRNKVALFLINMTDSDLPTGMRSREPPDAAAQPPPPKNRKVLFEEGDTPSFLIGPYHYSFPQRIQGPRRMEPLCSSDVATVVADGEEGSRAFGRLPGKSNGTVGESSRRSSGFEPADLGPLKAKAGCGEPATVPAEKSSGKRLKKSPPNLNAKTAGRQIPTPVGKSPVEGLNYRLEPLVVNQTC